MAQLGSQGAFARTMIPPPYIHIARFGYSMVQARLLLLRHAAGAKPPAEWFIFFSESDAPLRSCPDALRFLARRAGARSFAYADPPSPGVELGSRAWAQSFRHSCPQCAAANISAADYRHGPGWVALHRSHVLPILEREPTLEPVFSTATGLGVPDEWFWTTLVQAQDGRRHNHLLTYMQPGDAKTGHSKTFGPHDLPELVAKAHAAAPSFFARKFPTTPQMDEALLCSLLSTRFRSGAHAAHAGAACANNASARLRARNASAGAPSFRSHR